MSLLPRTSSAKWWCRWLDERSRRKKGGGSYETKLVVLFVVVHGVSIGPNKEVGTFLSPTIFPTHIIEGSRGALLGGESVLEECFGRERERSIFFSTSRVLQGDLSDTVVLIAVYWFQPGGAHSLCVYSSREIFGRTIARFADRFARSSSHQVSLARSLARDPIRSPLSFPRASSSTLFHRFFVCSFDLSPSPSRVMDRYPWRHARQSAAT